VTLPVGATPDNVAAARLIAEAWAEREGLEIGAGRFNVLAQGAVDGPQWLGVAFDVVVGKGDIYPDDPKADDWRWSARMLHWRELLAGTGRAREGRRIVSAQEQRQRRWGGRDALEGKVVPLHRADADQRADGIERQP